MIEDLPVKFPLNLTMTLKPRVDLDYLILNFNGTFHHQKDAIVNLNSDGFPIPVQTGVFPEPEDLPSVPGSKLWIHENTLNSLQLVM